MSSRTESRLPIPASAITQPIGRGVPSAKTPTSAEPMMPHDRDAIRSIAGEYRSSVDIGVHRGHSSCRIMLKLSP
jgi:hypothetical protein